MCICIDRYLFIHCVCVFPAVSTCGLSENPGDRLAVKKVVRGNQTSISRWPWHVTLIQNLENKIDEVSRSYSSIHMWNVWNYVVCSTFYCIYVIGWLCLQSLKSLHGAGTIINDRWVLTAAHLFALFSTGTSSSVDHSIFIVAGELIPLSSVAYIGHVVYYDSSDAIKAKCAGWYRDELHHWIRD